MARASTSSRPRGCTRSTASAVTRSRKENSARIVSLLPSATEILFAIGAGDDIVGVTHECDFPGAARGLPQLTSSALPASAAPAAIDRHVRESLHAGSSLYHLDAGLLEQLAPDLIVTQELCDVCTVSYDVVSRAARRLRSDPRVVSLEPSTLQDVFATIEFLGALTGRETGAQACIGLMRARLQTLRLRSGKNVSRPLVLVLEWSDPPMSAGHWIPELIEIAGGEPVLHDRGANSRRLSWDQIADSDPDVVIVAP
ncbi:MAG: ABC transporter substrate-binding protein, partial [Candidatus Eremiobacteraeota bacterium]|nr:ABC transporter substrate-binding protein [Candidatus Eremiobacteraeota bacterium]